MLQKEAKVSRKLTTLSSAKKDEGYLASCDYLQDTLDWMSTNHCDKLGPTGYPNKHWEKS